MEPFQSVVIRETLIFFSQLTGKLECHYIIDFELLKFVLLTSFSAGVKAGEKRSVQSFFPACHILMILRLNDKITQFWNNF